jgi:hypothetical protein
MARDIPKTAAIHLSAQQKERRSAYRRAPARRLTCSYATRIHLNASKRCVLVCIKLLAGVGVAAAAMWLASAPRYVIGGRSGAAPAPTS